MIALIAICIPPLILVWIRNRVFPNQMNDKDKILCYIAALVIVNWLMMALLYFVFNSKGELVSKLNSYNIFACKYIALASFISAVLPYIERFVKEKVVISVDKPTFLVRYIKGFNHWKVLAIIYASVLFFLNFIRIFDNNFWADEAYTANLIQHSVPEMISLTAADVHPPLYYLFVKLAYTVFGNQGWAFHIVSLIPCAIMILFALSAIWKKFGKETSFIFITIACLSSNAVKYNVEIRMYSWGGLFILLSFYYFCCIILDNNRTKDYVLFALFSVLAAYTHYYCVASVAFLYLTLLFFSFFKRVANRKKTLLVYAATIIGYSPWLFIMLNSLLDRADGVWISSIPTFKESMEYLFSSQFPAWLWCLMAFGTIIFIAYEAGIIIIKREENYRISFTLNFKTIHLSNYIIIFAAGILSVIGTISLAIIMSVLICPLYVLRYIYPVSVIAWLLLGIIISRLKGKRLYAVLLVIVLLILFLPVYKKTYTSEKKANDTLQTTLEDTKDISVQDIILTNHSHIRTICGYYYPGTNVKLINLPEIPELEVSTTYWLIIKGKQDMDETFTQIMEQGFAYEEIVNAGNLGTNTVYIYKAEFDPLRSEEQLTQIETAEDNDELYIDLESFINYLKQQ